MSEKNIKYPRTFHLSFSKGCHNDDKFLDDDAVFLNTDIIITSKLDGSNVCLTNKELFARSHNGPPTHQSFDWLKSFHSQIKFDIPDNIAIYCEYLFAKHSIYYENLPHYLFAFNVFDLKEDRWLSWLEVESMSKKISIPTVPLLWNGIMHTNMQLQNRCDSFMKEKDFDVNEREGVVVRLANSFDEKDFSITHGKCVRANHVQTTEHWKDQQIVRNKLKT